MRFSRGTNSGRRFCGLRNRRACFTPLERTSKIFVFYSLDNFLKSCRPGLCFVSHPFCRKTKRIGAKKSTAKEKIRWQSAKMDNPAANGGELDPEEIEGPIFPQQKSAAVFSPLICHDRSIILPQAPKAGFQGFSSPRNRFALRQRPFGQ